MRNRIVNMEDVDAVLLLHLEHHGRQREGIRRVAEERVRRNADVVVVDETVVDPEA